MRLRYNSIKNVTSIFYKICVYTYIHVISNSNEECHLLSILYDQSLDILKHEDKLDAPPSLRVLVKFSQYRLATQAPLLAQQ